MSSDYSGSQSSNGGGRNKPWIQAYSVGQRDVIKIIALLAGLAVSCLVIYETASPLPVVLMPSSSSGFASSSPWTLANASAARNTSKSSLETRKPVSELERILMNASMENKTVIITALNQAWAEPNSTFDLFLESFRIGEGTQELLNHVVAACTDQKAYTRCLQLHPHCYLLNATGNDLSAQNTFMTPGYLELIWRRMEFVREVLELGYSFIFTDADIMWLRNPFPRLYPNIEFQIACDHYFGDPYNLDNWVNSGFTYVQSNNRTIQFYKFWCNSSKTYPDKHDQDVFNLIKHEPIVAEIGIQMRFLDTLYFGSFCQPSRDINLVCTMHANCCIGLERKVNDLKLVLEDWRKYLAASAKRKVKNTKWSIPAYCR